MKSMWVGFAFFLGVLVLGFATLMIKDISIGGEPVMLFVGLDEALGLESGDDVRVDGIPIGKVKYVGLFDSNFKKQFLDPAGISDEDYRWIIEERDRQGYTSQGVAVIAQLNRPVELFKDAKVAVEGLALIGGAYLSIRSGSISLERKDLTSFRERIMIGKAKKGFMDAGADFIEKNSKAVEDILTNLTKVTDNLKEITGDFRKGEGWLPGEIKGLRKDINKPLDEATTAMEKLSDSMDEVKEILGKINDGQGTVGKLINDPTLHDEMLGTIREVRDSVREVTDAINKGNGTVAKLLHDEEMGNQLKETVTNINSAAKRIDNVVKSIEEGWLPGFMKDQEVGDDLKSSVSGLQNTVGRIGNAQSFLKIESNSFSDSEVGITRAHIHLWPTEDKTIILGGAFMSLHPEGDILYDDLLADGSEASKTKLEAQLAYKIPWYRDLTFRAGAIEGKPGMGLDWSLQNILGYPVKFSFEARDAYDDVTDDDIDELLETPALYRAYLRAPLYTKSENNSWFENLLSTFHLTVGVNRLWDEEETFVGIGVEYEEPDIKSFAGMAGP